MSDESIPVNALRHWVNWRSTLLAGACVAGGLTLNMMVLAITPDRASDAIQVADPVEVASGGARTVSADVPAIVPEPAASGTLPTLVAESGTVGAAAPAAVEQVATDATFNSIGPASALATAAPLVPATPTNTAAAVASPPVVATPPAPTPSVPATPPAPTTAPPTTITPTTAAPPTVAPTTAAPTTAAPQRNVSYPSYSTVGGEIYLAVVDGSSISVYSVVRGDGWVHQVDRNGPRSVEVKFFNVNTEQEAEFHATIESGSIKVES